MQDGTTPLLLGVTAGNLAMVEWLHRHGADLHARTKQGAPLIVAACQNAHLNIAQWLLARGADVNATMDDGVSSLIVAAQIGSISIVSWLGANGANVNARVQVYCVFLCVVG